MNNEHLSPAEKGFLVHDKPLSPTEKGLHQIR